MQNGEIQDNSAVCESQLTTRGHQPVQISVGVEGGGTETAFVVFGADPVVLSSSELAVYERLLQGPNKPLSGKEIIGLISQVVTKKNPHSILNRLESRYGCLRLVSGEPMSRINPPMRQVVHRPYRSSGSCTVDIPYLCHPDNNVQPAVATEVVVPVTESVSARSPQMTSRLRSREELGAEFDELQKRVDTLVGELRERQREQLTRELDEVKVRERQFRDALVEAEDQREAVEQSIANLDKPNVDFRKQFAIPDDVVVLLDRAQRVQRAYERYDELVALFAEVVVYHTTEGE